MKLLVMIVVLACVPLGSASAQSGVCSAPSAPAPIILSSIGEPPALPKCIDPDRGTHTCRGREIRDHNAAMEAYNTAQRAQAAAHNAYVQRLQSYIRAVGVYVACETDRLRREMSPPTDDRPTGRRTV